MAGSVQQVSRDVVLPGLSQFHLHISAICVVPPPPQAARGRMTVLLDGDNIRHGLNKNLGFR